MAEAKETGGNRFPFINLEKAVGRAQELFNADERGREMSVAGAFTIWDYSEKSSGGFQTIAALKAYGLITTTGTGKIGLSESALRYFRHEDEGEKKKLLSKFALTPPLIATLWKSWHATPPADTLARSHLKADRHLNDQAARTLLTIYKDNIAFADIKGDDIVDAPNEEEDGGSQDDAAQRANANQQRSHRPPPPPSHNQTEKVMAGERIVFTEEGKPSQYLKLIASGEVDDGLLEALEDFVKRQRKRLKVAAADPKPN
jgi:hypothetical protein